ncbi:hypothetical protein BDV95DRAFT_597688 [Massariosphaeria phaeospora]|uniref:Uncharacterized protein n=1 Tax=Massariosphaeria phaeospora TaxID=100035 RepID=A0A7C8I4E7_9PLEO|nr:hypothetical protein BDV95DRAFT_597688 [Massariosphaeria phaeospora]
MHSKVAAVLLAGAQLGACFYSVPEPMLTNEPSIPAPSQTGSSDGPQTLDQCTHLRDIGMVISCASAPLGGKPSVPTQIPAQVPGAAEPSSGGFYVRRHGGYEDVPAQGTGTPEVAKPGREVCYQIVEAHYDAAGTPVDHAVFPCYNIEGSAPAASPSQTWALSGGWGVPSATPIATAPEETPAPGETPSYDDETPADEETDEETPVDEETPMDEETPIDEEYPGETPGPQETPAAPVVNAPYTNCTDMDFFVPDATSAPETPEAEMSILPYPAPEDTPGYGSPVETPVAPAETPDYATPKPTETPASYATETPASYASETPAAYGSHNH